MKNVIVGAINVEAVRSAPFGAPAQTREERELEINVAFTSKTGTLSAIRHAATLAAGLKARIRLIVPQVVPYPLPLDKPPVATEFMVERLRNLTTKAGTDISLEICLCREIAQAYTVALPKNSLVIVGGRKHWWPTRESKLVRSLASQGHNVLFVNTEKES